MNCSIINKIYQALKRARKTLAIRMSVASAGLVWVCPTKILTGTMNEQTSQNVIKTKPDTKMNSQRVESNDKA